MIEVQAAERVVVLDGDFFLHQDGAGIEPIIRPEDAQPGFLVALDDRPVDGARAAVQRQQRRVVLNAAERWNIERLLRDDQRDIGHDAEICIEGCHLLPDLRLLEGLRLKQGQAVFQRSLFYRVDPFALVRLAVNTHYFFPASKQCIQHGFPICLLAVDQNFHDVSWFCSGSNWFASDSGRAVVLRVLMSMITLVTVASQTHRPSWS